VFLKNWSRNLRISAPRHVAEATHVTYLVRTHARTHQQSTQLYDGAQRFDERIAREEFKKQKSKDTVWKRGQSTLRRRQAHLRNKRHNPKPQHDGLNAQRHSTSEASQLRTYARTDSAFLQPPTYSTKSRAHHHTHNGARRPLRHSRRLSSCSTPKVLLARPPTQHLDNHHARNRRNNLGRQRRVHANTR
jgi:hypothetical protein